MVRQSISFTQPNEEWLKEQIASEEYASKSELVNDLIRQARGSQAQIDWLQAKIDSADASGYMSLTKKEIIERVKMKKVE